MDRKRRLIAIAIYAVGAPAVCGLVGLLRSWSVGEIAAAIIALFGLIWLCTGMVIDGYALGEAILSGLYFTAWPIGLLVAAGHHGYAGVWAGVWVIVLVFIVNRFVRAALRAESQAR
ncbi:MAG TPA: hypothetical protein VLF67_01675 [Candidatus Saccharimonas sp.]|nr:hypothetical protein [Candidatus Saccharimonas sp.]